MTQGFGVWDGDLTVEYAFARGLTDTNGSAYIGWPRHYVACIDFFGIWRKAFTISHGALLAALWLGRIGLST